jgi:phage terminase large subunit-like protein
MAKRKPRLPGKALEILEEYVANVLVSDQPANRLVRLACERHRRDLERDDIAFDVAPVQDWLEFTRGLKHPRGDAAERGEYFEPLPWQVFVVGSILGWRVEPSGHRRYRLGLVEVARGNGKTVLMSSVLLWAFMRGQGRQVFTFANTQRQAKLCFSDAAAMARSMSEEELPDPRTDRRRWRDRTYGISETKLKDEEHRNILEAIPAKESSLDGLDPWCWVGDEASEYQTRSLQKLTTSTVKRRDAFGILITTPGSSQTNIYYDYRDEGVEVLAGSESGDGTFYFLCGIDEGDDPADVKQWGKANPSLGHTIIQSDLEQRYQSDLAKGPRYVADFVRFHLARYTGDCSSWIPSEHWEACESGPRPDDELIGGRAWFGVDLSKTRDLTAVVGIIEHPKDGTLWIRGWYFYPEEQARERERVLRLPILKWGLEGLVHLNPGRTIDYSAVHDVIRQAHGLYDVHAFYFDPFMTGWGEQQLEAEGIPVWGLQQTITQLSPGTLHVESLVADAKLHHDGDPVLTRAIANSRCYIDTNQNVRLNKAKSEGLIDPAMALCMAARARLESTAIVDICPVF